jgi:hypothetical protein
VTPAAGYERESERLLRLQRTLQTDPPAASDDAESGDPGDIGSEEITPAARAAQQAAEHGRGPATGPAPESPTREARPQTRQKLPERAPGKGKKR